MVYVITKLLHDDGDDVIQLSHNIAKFNHATNNEQLSGYRSEMPI